MPPDTMPSAIQAARARRQAAITISMAVARLLDDGDASIVRLGEHVSEALRGTGQDRAHLIAADIDRAVDTLRQP